MKKVVLLTIAMVAIATLFSFAAVTAKPPTEQPPGLETVWTAINALWTNATAQQGEIDIEEAARDTADQALWANATEQQADIDGEITARDAADDALWLNATEQQTAIEEVEASVPDIYVDWYPFTDEDEQYPPSNMLVGHCLLIPPGYSEYNCNVIVSPGFVDLTPEHLPDYTPYLESGSTLTTPCPCYQGSTTIEKCYNLHAHIRFEPVGGGDPSEYLYRPGYGQYLIVCKK